MDEPPGAGHTATALTETIRGTDRMAMEGITIATGRGNSAADHRNSVNFCECGDHAWRVLNLGFVTLVSVDDAEILGEGSWHVAGSTRVLDNFYVVSRRGYLHKRIAARQGDGPTDHRFRNPMDNRRPSLRPATRSQNSANRRKSLRSSSRFMGVSFNMRQGKWIAQIQCQHRRKYLGIFEAEEDAAAAYQAAAKELHGEFASDHRRPCAP